MPITFVCACGKSLRVGDEHAGRRVQCPACGTVGSVPKPNQQSAPANQDEPQFEVEERPAKKATAPDDDDDFENDVPRQKKKPVRDDDDDDDDDEPRQKKNRARDDDDDDDDDEPRPRKKKRARDDDDDEDDEPRPRKKKKRRRRSSAYSDDYRDDNRGRGESDLTGADLLLCILCPGIGCIVGLVRLITGNTSGAKMIGISMVVAVIGTVIRVALMSAAGK